MAETTATVGETRVLSVSYPWYGGRDGHCVYEDDWVADRSWSYYKKIFPLCTHGGDPSRWQCDLCKDVDNVYLKLYVDGSNKGRLKAVSAWLRAGFSSERYRGLEIDLGRTPVISCKAAKKWADGFSPDWIVKVIFQTFYGSFKLSYEKPGHLIEALIDDEGWQEWLWVFDQHPDWNDLLSKSRAKALRYRYAKDSGYSLIKGGSFGYTITSWPSAWDRIARRGEHWGQPMQDEFGPL